MAEVLQTTEQELFINDNKSRKRFFLNIIKTANSEEIDIIKNKFNLKYENTSKVKEPTNKYEKSDSLEKEFISLLPYAPKPLLQNFVEKLKELKDFNDTL